MATQSSKVVRQSDIDSMFEKQVSMSDIDTLFPGQEEAPDTSAVAVLPQTPEQGPFDRIREAVSQPGRMMNRGINRFAENPIAGGADMFNALLGTVALPFTAGTAALQEIPVVGKPAAKAIGLPFEAAAAGEQLGEKGVQSLLNALGISQNVQNLGLSPKTAQEAAGAVSGVDQTLAEYLLGMGAGKAKTALAPKPLTPEGQMTKLRETVHDPKLKPLRAPALEDRPEPTQTGTIAGASPEELAKLQPPPEPVLGPPPPTEQAKATPIEEARKAVEATGMRFEGVTESDGQQYVHFTDMEHNGTLTRKIEEVLDPTKLSESIAAKKREFAPAEPIEIPAPKPEAPVEAPPEAPTPAPPPPVAETPAPEPVQSAPLPEIARPGASTEPVPSGLKPSETVDEKPERMGKEAAGPGASQMVPIPVSMTPAAAKPVKASAIIDQVSKDLGVPIRTGHANFRKRAGFFGVKIEVVRNKEANDLAVTAHEIAHYIDKKVLGAHQAGSSQRFTAWRKELADLDYDQKKRRTNEGFAEFVRHYITMDDAQSVAPKFYDHFTKDFLPANPKVADALGKMKGSVTRWRQQGAKARVLSQIDFDGTKARPTIGEAVRTLGYGVQKTMENALAPLNRVVNEMVKDTGVRPEARQDPYQIAMAVAKTAPAKARAMVLEGAFNFRGEKVGPSLKEILAPVNKDIEGAIAYGYAKRAVEKHGQGINPGITLEDAQYVIRTSQSPAFDTFVKNVTDWNGHVMDYLVDAGGLSKEGAAAIRESNLVYIPLKRVFVDKAGSFGAGRGYVDLASPIKKMKGSGREIQNPLEAMIQQAEQIIAIADKTRVARALVDLADAHEGMGKWVERVRPPMEATRFQAEQLRPQLEAMGIELPLEEMDNLLTVFSNGQKYFGKDNIVSIVRNGKREFYELHPDLYATMKGMDKVVLGPAINLLLGKPARAVRLGATGIRAGFALITNPIRDAQTFALQTEHTRGTPELALRGILKDLGHSDVARQFRAGGGEMSQPLGLDRRMVQNLVEEALASDAKRKALHVVHHPIEALKELISFPESGPRLAEYEAVMKKWKPRIDEALSGGDNVRASQLRENAMIEGSNAAADVTVNFRRMGTYTAVLNQIIPFFNPGVQGITKMGRTMIEHPIRSGIRATAVLTAPTLALWYINKDEGWYKALPEWQKLGFWNFKLPDWVPIVGGQIMRLPKPFEWGYLFAGVPEAALNAAYQKDPELFTRTLTQIAKNFGPVDLTDPVSMLISPALIKPAAEAYFNWDTFRDRPIVPRGLEGLLPSEQYTSYTSGTAKTLGKILGVAPAKLDHVLSGYTGGLASDILKGLPSEMKEAADIPIVGRIFTRADALGLGSEPVQRFYETLDKATRYKTTIDRYLKLKPGEIPDKERVDRAVDFLKYDETAQQLYFSFKMLNDVAGKLKDLRDKQRSLDQVDLDAGTKKLFKDAVSKSALTLVNAAQTGTRIAKKAIQGTAIGAAQ